MLDNSDNSRSLNQNFATAVDIQATRHANDLLTIETYLKEHPLLGNFFTRYWDNVKSYIHLEEYHKEVTFVKYNETNRKICLLFSGTAAAYVITKDSPAPIVLHKFSPDHLLSDLDALFISPKRYGFVALEDCSVISIDLGYLEHQQSIDDLYSDLIAIVYNDMAKVATSIFNNMLKNRIDLENLLGRYNLFPHIAQLDAESLNSIVLRLNYVFLPSNEILIDGQNTNTIYLIESGSVQEIRTHTPIEQKNTYLGTRQLMALELDNRSIINQIPEFDTEFKDSANINNDKIFIKENVYRYGVVGEEYIGQLNTIELSATTITPCCLLEVKLDPVIKKDSIFAQIATFFNYKIKDIEINLLIKQKNQINSNNYNLNYLYFGFLVMVILAIAGVFGGFFNHSYFTLSTHVSLMYHTGIIAVMGVVLAYLIQLFQISLKNFGLTTANFSKVLYETAIFITLTIVIITAFKEFYIYLHHPQEVMKLFELNIVSSTNLGVTHYAIFFIIYIAYSFLYEFYIRGVIQNIFLTLITNNHYLRFWGSILASAVIGSQLNFSLFNEFGIMLFICSLGAGILFARTRNLWAVFIFHVVVGIYAKLILGLLSSSYF